jgi:anaerobic selenocysteine-containing dehydrogenase
MRTADKASVHYRNCNLCEAICGIEITVQDPPRETSDLKTTQRSEHSVTQVESRNSKLETRNWLDIRGGDKDDPFSRGYICPKAVAYKICTTIKTGSSIPCAALLKVGNASDGTKLLTR